MKQIKLIPIKESGIMIPNVLEIIRGGVFFCTVFKE